MSGLFFIFFIAMIFIAIGWRTTAMWIIGINLILCFWMLFYYLSMPVNINL